MIRVCPNGVTLATPPCFRLGRSAGNRFASATTGKFGLWILTIAYPFAGDGRGTGVEGQVESNERYYRRRAVEERMAARRAVSETARAWHAKLAEDFAQRAMTSTDSCAIPALINS